VSWIRSAVVTSGAEAAMIWLWLGAACSDDPSPTVPDETVPAEDDTGTPPDDTGSPPTDCTSGPPSTAAGSR
jgi:hypothetical protein